jgi:hypothetical protein
VDLAEVARGEGEEGASSQMRAVQEGTSSSDFSRDGFIPDLLTLICDTEIRLLTKHHKKWDDLFTSIESNTSLVYLIF